MEVNGYGSKVAWPNIPNTQTLAHAHIHCARITNAQNLWLWKMSDNLTINSLPTATATTITISTTTTTTITPNYHEVNNKEYENEIMCFNKSVLDRQLPVVYERWCAFFTHQTTFQVAKFLLDIFGMAFQAFISHHFYPKLILAYSHFHLVVVHSFWLFHLFLSLCLLCTRIHPQSLSVLFSCVCAFFVYEKCHFS